MNELALFAGAGGGILGGKLLGWRTVCAVEIDAYCRRVLLARQRDGMLDPFPIWDDVRTFDGKPWRGRVDVVSGGFPCQDISVAGGGAGIEGKRSGLWEEMFRILCEVRPRFALIENSPALLKRGIGRILRDLSAAGWSVEWGCFRASAEGAPIERERIFIAGANSQHGKAWLGNIKNGKEKIFRGQAGSCPSFWLQTPSRNIGVVNGMADYMDRVKAIGNGQVPIVAATAWNILMDRIQGKKDEKA